MIELKAGRMSPDIEDMRPEYRDDVKRIIKICKRAGYKISPHDAWQIWVDYSTMTSGIWTHWEPVAGEERTLRIMKAFSVNPMEDSDADIPPRNGSELIAKERQRQIGGEDWSAEHDDQHRNGELSIAAACYAATKKIFIRSRDDDKATIFSNPWPFGHTVRGRSVEDADTFFQGEAKLYPTRIRELVIAGALIAAEIDRLQRKILLEKDKNEN